MDRRHPYRILFFPRVDRYEHYAAHRRQRFFRAFTDIGFGATGINFDTGQTIGVGGGAFGSISFFRGLDGLYYASPFEQVPEPGTLELIGTGLMGIVAVARKRLRTRQLFRSQ